MAFQPATNIAQVTVQGRVDGQITINNLYFEVSGGGITAVNLAQLVSAVDFWASDSLAPQLSDDWSYEITTGRDLTVANGVQVTASAPTPGGVSGEANPNNVAVCVSLRTAFGGRSFRGRNYVPGIPATAVTLNSIDPTFSTNLLVVYNALVGAGTFEPGWQLVVLSRYTLGNPRAVALGAPVTACIITRPYVASMRSRAVGHGA